MFFEVLKALGRLFFNLEFLFEDLGTPNGHWERVWSVLGDLWSSFGRLWHPFWTPVGFEI